MRAERIFVCRPQTFFVQTLVLGELLRSKCFVQKTYSYEVAKNHKKVQTTHRDFLNRDPALSAYRHVLLPCQLNRFRFIPIRADQFQPHFGAHWPT